MSHIAICLLAILTLLSGCGGGDTSSGKDTEHKTAATGEPPVASAGPAAGVSTMISGSVVETMDAGRYTYILVQTAGEKIWAAGPLTAIKVGEKVSFPAGLVMENFSSPALDRTFDTIYFVTSFSATDGEGANPHAGIIQGQDNDRTVAAPPNAVGEIEKAPGGFTVAEIYSRKAELAGQTVKVRAAVVKFTPAIMGRNWIHVQDGTGAAGSVDLTVTTDATVKVGDVILVQGILAVDKDFGAGYRYEVIVEKAQLIGE